MTALLLGIIEWGCAASMVAALAVGLTGSPAYLLLALAALPVGLTARSLAGLAGRRTGGDRA